MNDDLGDQNFSDEQDVDPGEPVALLAALEQDMPPAFLGVVRRKIHRRTAVSHFASFSWNMPKMILIELWRVLIEMVNPTGSAPKRGRS